MSQISDDFLYLEDWKMTKDRIKHFDDIVIRLRLEALPITAAVISLAFLVNLQPMLWFAAAYLVPIFILDLVHFDLLLKAVKHAEDIEKKPQFNKKLDITTSLTTSRLTFFHRCCYILYFIVWGIIGYLMYIQNITV